VAANLTFYIFEGVLTGTANGHMLNLTAVSGGGGGSKVYAGNSDTFNPHSQGLKEVDGKHHVHGGPIPAGRYKVLGFVISAGCAALGGLVNTAVVTEANPDASPAIIFTALTAVALAGVSLAGGRGSLPRVLVGALLLATIANGLTVKGIDPYWGTGVTGLLLLASLGLEKWISDSVSNRLVATAQASVHSGRR